uniref:RING-type domain-containing protein n=1 Tax=Norrisiella sphaerica TaxID=552664 RepID=A0A7S2QSB1_9EUKA
MVEKLNACAHRFPNKDTGEVLQFRLVAVPRNFCLDFHRNSRHRASTSVDSTDSKAVRKENLEAGIYRNATLEEKGGVCVHPRVCPEQHLLHRFCKRLPPIYIGRHKSVYCNDCKRRSINLDEESFWHCGICEYDCCSLCMKIPVIRVIVESFRETEEEEKNRSVPIFRLLLPAEFTSLYTRIIEGCGMLSESITSEIMRKSKYSSQIRNSQSKNVPGRIACVSQVTTENGKEEEEDDAVCEICFDESVKVVLGCTHAFCQGCLDSWARSNGSCPMCRTPLDKTKVESVGWVIANEEDELLQIGEEILTKIWSQLESNILVPASPRAVFGNELSDISEQNINKISNQLSLLRVTALL